MSFKRVVYARHLVLLNNWAWHLMSFKSLIALYYMFWQQVFLPTLPDSSQNEFSTTADLIGPGQMSDTLIPLMCSS